jgi:hypothetical protein
MIEGAIFMWEKVRAKMKYGSRESCLWIVLLMTMIENYIARHPPPGVFAG